VCATERAITCLDIEYLLIISCVAGIGSGDRTTEERLSDCRIFALLWFLFGRSTIAKEGRKMRWRPATGTTQNSVRAQ
jgi:hypothetical protein